MDRDANPHRKSSAADETVRTSTSSPLEGEKLDSELRKEIATPVAGAPAANKDAIKEVEKHNARTGKQKRAEKLQLMAMFWSLFYAGCSDGSIGPLIPRIQEVYDVGFTTVSLIFIFYCVGFVLGSFANFYLSHHAGFGKTAILGSIFQIVACALQAPGPPFPVFVVAHALNGFGTVLQVSQALGLIVRFKRNNDIKMGFYQAVYGIGALSIPFASTQFAQMRYWNLFYLIPLGIAVSNFISLSLIFGFKTMDDCLRLIGYEVGEKNLSERSPIGQVLRVKATHYVGFLCFFYNGVQISLGGWIVTFLLKARGGNVSSGYVASGFYAGLMLGRVVFLGVNRKLGARLAMFCYISLAIVLELVIWFVPSLIGGATAVCVVGLLLGPMYPLAMVHLGHILPESLVPNTIIWVVGFGKTGSAAFPFLTGAISSKYGIVTLHPLTIAVLGCMLLSWYLVPARKPT